MDYQTGQKARKFRLLSAITQLQSMGADRPQSLLLKAKVASSRTRPTTAWLAVFATYEGEGGVVHDKVNGCNFPEITHFEGEGGVEQIMQV